MLSPEYLDKIEFNKVVELYDKLNISIMADIIERVSQMQDITVTTREQLKILIQTNGIEIFNKALEEALILRADTKKELRLMFEQMAKEDMEGYKELYEYRDKPFKLSQTQYKILNQGLVQTNKNLKNFTNTIAFQSKQAYVEAVDEAYFKVASGAFNYATAINQAAQKLADKGITLKDKAGRNVQLEVAIRRNIRWGLQETANKINRDIEDELGCDGYEVTAHVGARPTHAEEQGKQFALTKEDASKYNVGLWSDVEDLWQEYNCRHSYFGIILGVSEPVYSDKELKDYKNATVNYNGKEIPYYEATQKQRAIENEIRKTTRSAKILEKAKLDSSIQRAQLRQLNKELKNFLSETGLNKDYSRIKVAVSTNSNKSGTISQNNKNEESKLKYLDITDNLLKNNKQKYEVIKQQSYKDGTGNKYKIDGKHVTLKPTTREIEVAKLLGEIYGGKIRIVPRVSYPLGVKTPDYIINNEKFDLKQITGNGKYVIEGNLRKKKEQSNNFIIDVTESKLTIDEIKSQINSIYISKRFKWIDKILVVKENSIKKIYKRK